MNHSEKSSVQLLRMTSWIFATIKQLQKNTLEMNHSNQSAVQLLETNLRKCVTIE
jgi:hypothetical protein